MMMVLRRIMLQLILFVVLLFSIANYLNYYSTTKAEAATTTTTTTITITTSSTSSSSSPSSSLRKALLMSHDDDDDDDDDVDDVASASTITSATTTSSAASSYSSSSVMMDSSSSLLLPIGDVNLLVLTDIHSWIGGHGRHYDEDGQMDVDYGDVISFVEQLKKRTQQKKNSFPNNLFLVMNGDFMDGTGLSTYPPKYLTPLLQRMPFDIINIGNHELYNDITVDWITRKFVPYWNGTYLTTNTFIKSTNQPIGDQYTYLKIPITTTTNNDNDDDDDDDDDEEDEDDPSSSSFHQILVFGFLYNFDNHCNSTIVSKVEDVVNQTWFSNVILDKNYEAILVMAHMHVTDPLVTIILNKIRQILGPTYKDMPIQFITGHTHIRSYEILDDYSVSFEAGRFLDTIGFCSFPLHTNLKKRRRHYHQQQQQRQRHQSHRNLRASAAGGTMTAPNGTTTTTKATTTTNMLFPHVYLDTNRQSLSKVLSSMMMNDNNGDDIDDDLESSSALLLQTSSGIEMSNKIHETQESLGLLEIVGCSPNHFQLNTRMNQPSNSLWWLYMAEVIPKTLFLDDDKYSYNNNNKATATAKTSRDEDEQVFKIIPIFVQGTGGLRYDLFSGIVVADDVIAVCPFNDTVYKISSSNSALLSGIQLLQFLDIPIPSHKNNNNDNDDDQDQDTIMVSLNDDDVDLDVRGEDNGSKYFYLATSITSPINPFATNIKYEIYTSNFHRSDFVHRIQDIIGQPIPDPQPVIRHQRERRGGGRWGGLKDDDDDNDDDPVHQPVTSSFWTTTELWMDFIRNEWPASLCKSNSDNGSQSNSGTRTDKIASSSSSSSSTTLLDYASSSTTKIVNAPTPIVEGDAEKDDGIETFSDHDDDPPTPTPTPNITIKEENTIETIVFIALIGVGIVLYRKRQKRLRMEGYAPIPNNNNRLNGHRIQPNFSSPRTLSERIFRISRS